MQLSDAAALRSMFGGLPGPTIPGSDNLTLSESITHRTQCGAAFAGLRMVSVRSRWLRYRWGSAVRVVVRCPLTLQ